MELPVSQFANARNTTPEDTFPLAGVIECIRQGVIQEQIDEIRRLRAMGTKEAKEEADRKKIALPAFTSCGVFSPTRKKENLTSYTGVLPFDIDHIAGGFEYAKILRDQIGKREHVVYSFVSPSGEGVKFGVLVQSGPEDHAWAYDYLFQWINRELESQALSADPKNKDIGRLTFFSSDPDAIFNTGVIGLAIPPAPKPFGPPRGGTGRNPPTTQWPGEEHLKAAESVLGKVNWLPRGVCNPARTILAYMPCPGKNLHTGKNAETDCALIVGEQDPVVMVCFHEHCRNEVRKINHALSICARDTIYLPGLGISMGTWAEEVGEKIGPRNLWFSKDGMVVTVEEAQQSDYDADNPRVTSNLMPLDPIRAVCHADKAVVFISPTKKSRGAISSITPAQATILLHAPQLLDRLPKLRAIESISAPMLLRGEVVYPKPGYNPELETWISPKAPTPEPMDLETAKKTLLIDLWEDFPFRDEQVEGVKREDSINRRHALAALLSGFTRNLLVPVTTTVPLFIFQANAPRAGKDTAANLIQIVNTGRFAELGLPADNEEFDKLILGWLLRGSRHLHFSNVRGDIDLTSLERFLTSDYYTGRKLGVNLNIEIPRTCLTSMSANMGYTVSPDLRARAVTIELHVTEADPNSRVFHRPDLLEEVRCQRPRIVGALKTVVDHWVNQGMPSGRSPFASAPVWQRVIGGIMGCTWGVEPKVNLANVRLAVDPLEADWDRFCQIMLENHPGEKLTAKELRSVIEQYNTDIDCDEPLFVPWMESTRLGGGFSGHGKQAFGSILARKVMRDFPGGRMVLTNPMSKTERRKFCWEPTGA